MQSRISIIHLLCDYLIYGAKNVDPKGIERRNKKIQNQFSFILNSTLSEQFRKVLRQFSLTTSHIKTENKLEVILYNNDSDEIILSEKLPFFPRQKTIHKQYHLYNNYYKFFHENDEIRYQQFYKFFIAAKLIADYVEENNDDKNEIAFLHAYKMLVLFGDIKKVNAFDRIQKYVAIHNFSLLKTPLHDILVFPLPVNCMPPLQLNAWRELIIKSGPKALLLFQRAVEIERVLGRAPKNIMEGQKINSRLAFTYHAAYPELADLCISFNLNDEIFNRCLEITKRSKVNDYLPNIMLNGKDIGHPGYFLVKLSPNDPRSYLLGYFTNCCQSVGGNGEQCVIDGITRAHNGFYILLKGPADGSPFKSGESDEINYHHFKIVGQGYAWLSINGNLTFDSWENLRPEADDGISVTMLKAFGEWVGTEYPEILRISIGVGGKTPIQFCQLSTYEPEKIREGIQPPDSKQQADIYINQQKLKILIKYLLHNKTDIQLAWPKMSDKIISLICNKMISFNEAHMIKTLFINPNHPCWKKIETSSIVSKLQQLNLKNMSQLISAFYYLHKAKILTENNLSLIINDEDLIEIMSDGLRFLHKSKILTEENLILYYNLLMDNTNDKSKIIWIFQVLYNEKILSDHNFKLLADNFDKNTTYLLMVLSFLQKNWILTDVNFNLLMDSSCDALMELTNVLRILHESNLLSDKNFKWVTDCASQDLYKLMELANTLQILYHAKLLSVSNFKLLIHSPQTIYLLSESIQILEQAKLLSQTNLMLLLDNVENSQILTKILKLLNVSGILSIGTLAFLAHHAKQASDLENILQILQENNFRTLNKNQYMAFFNQRLQSSKIVNNLTQDHFLRAIRLDNSIVISNANAIKIFDQTMILNLSMENEEPIKKNSSSFQN